MGIMLAAPILLIIVFKIIITIVIPFIALKLGFDFAPYLHYIFAFVLLISSGMLGIVAGFMMLDDRDGNIADLMMVTPLGRSGYLMNRLFLASFFSFLYCILGIIFIGISPLTVVAIINLSILSAIYSAIIGLLLFSFAEDKVKGLTFAKGLNIIALFALTDILSLPWLTTISYLFPPYWITAIIKSPNSLSVNLLALLVHLVWLTFLISRYWKKEK
jgi:hypothetical protein